MIRTSLLTIALMVSITLAADWPQWRGPDLNGTSLETNLPAALDDSTQLWKIPLPGPSAATPVILNGKIYLPSTETDSKRLLALCLDAATGQVLWQQPVAEANQRFGQGNTMASCSPCADPTGAAFLFAEGTLIKFSPAGEKLWTRNIIDDYGPLTLDFGFSSSPLLYDGKLYIPVLRRTRERRSESPAELESYLLCISHADGKTIFKHDRPTDAIDESTNAYTTPITVLLNGQTHIVIYGGDYLTGHDPADGRELWRYLYSGPRGRLDRLIPSPVADGNRVYCGYPRGTKTFVVELTGADKISPAQAWLYDVPGPDISTPVIYKGYLYQIDEKQKILTCLNAATGQVQWTGQLDKSDMYYASITAADDKLYMVNRKGVITVAAADPQEFKILSTRTLDEKPADSTIAIAGGKLYLRIPQNLFCFTKPK